ncbi:hypothetical protein LSH36_453g02021 [Paralvinella palmiformis]|uniref:glycerophosphodiester phosphodiesterase n=1 Tax=Paralvinella palmiformis TaxID=53620 RepID=A0AAD9JAU3_9ANNE|nr:hypothetical protein LSH36_453g02021 [Paralvinella palmiformis]
MGPNIYLASVLFSFLFVANGAVFPPEFDHGVDLPTTRPLIIAHRGDSGVYPEHSTMAYRSAIDAGSDVIECDMCLTADLHVICSHESWLEDSTNVGELFPESRKSTYFVIDQLSNITDFFTVDFTLAELTQIRRRQTKSIRDPNHDDLYPMVGLDQLIQMIRNASRPIGLHLETKDPNWVNSLDMVTSANTTFEDVVLTVLDRHGYTDGRDPVFLQSFNADSLKYFRSRTDLPIIQLQATPMSDERLQEISGYAVGIGPPRELIVVVINDQIVEKTDLIARAHSTGLAVHAWTLRNEDKYLAWDYGQDPRNEYRDFLELGTDGIFTDHPRTYKNFLDAVYSCNKTDDASGIDGS